MPYAKALLTLLLAFCAWLHVPGAEPDPETARLRFMSDSLHAAGRTQEAIELGVKAIERAEATGDKAQILGTHSDIGVYLRSSGRVEEALQHYRAALEIATDPDFRSHADEEAIQDAATLYINLAVLEVDMAHREQAADYGRVAAEWAKQSTMTDFKAQAYGAIGSVLSFSDMQEAEKYQGLAYDYAMECGEDDSAFRAACYALYNAFKCDNARGVTLWRSRCKELLPRIDSMTARLLYLQVEAGICMKSKDYPGATDMLSRILRLEGVDAFPFVQYDACINLQEAYAHMGDYKQAYTTLLKATEVRDTIYAREKAESLRDLTVKYRTKETELALARSETARFRTAAWLVTALFILAVMVALFFLYASRQRRRALAREAEFANLRAEIGRNLSKQYVEGLEAERTRMARELHDGVCNDLLAVRMALQEPGDGDADGAARACALLEGCRREVRRISHELMPPEFAYATIDEVVRFFVEKHSGSGRPKLIFTAGKGPWQMVPDREALEIYRIAQEAIGNAIKHSGAATITVTMHMQQGEQGEQCEQGEQGRRVLLTVQDDGRFSQRGRGAGLDSMKRRAASVGGSLEVTHPGGATLITLSLPLPEHA